MLFIFLGLTLENHFPLWKYFSGFDDFWVLFLVDLIDWWFQWVWSITIMMKWGWIFDVWGWILLNEFWWILDSEIVNEWIQWQTDSGGCCWSPINLMVWEWLFLWLKLKSDADNFFFINLMVVNGDIYIYIIKSIFNF